jgi:hypothetical protein
MALRLVCIWPHPHPRLDATRHDMTCMNGGNIQSWSGTSDVEPGPCFYFLPPFDLEPGLSARFAVFGIDSLNLETWFELV